MRRLRNIALAIYLILAGLMAFGLTFKFIDYIVGAAAIVAGVLFLLTRK